MFPITHQRKNLPRGQRSRPPEPVWVSLPLLLFQLQVELCDLVSEAENIRIREEEQEVGAAALEQVWRSPAG